MIFVLQKHEASHLHYDFRLEIDGVLKSWALPKGMPAKPLEKHLAIQTEDHPLSYASFEGVIAEGYGAGKVTIIDKGTYKTLKKEKISSSFKKGKLEFILQGVKAKGAYALFRAMDDWLLMKLKDQS